MYRTGTRERIRVLVPKSGSVDHAAGTHASARPTNTRDRDRGAALSTARGLPSCRSPRRVQAEGCYFDPPLNVHAPCSELGRPEAQPFESTTRLTRRDEWVDGMWVVSKASGVNSVLRCGREVRMWGVVEGSRRLGPVGSSSRAGLFLAVRLSRLSCWPVSGRPHSARCSSPRAGLRIV